MKQCSERNQRFHFNSNAVKQCGWRSQRFHLNSCELKRVVSVVRDFILIVVK